MTPPRDDPDTRLEIQPRGERPVDRGAIGEARGHGVNRRRGHVGVTVAQNRVGRLTSRQIHEIHRRRVVEQILDVQVDRDRASVAQFPRVPKTRITRGVGLGVNGRVSINARIVDRRERIRRIHDRVRAAVADDHLAPVTHADTRGETLELALAERVIGAEVGRVVGRSGELLRPRDEVGNRGRLQRVPGVHGVVHGADVDLRRVVYRRIDRGDIRRVDQHTGVGEDLAGDAVLGGDEGAAVGSDIRLLALVVGGIEEQAPRTREVGGDFELVALGLLRLRVAHDRRQQAFVADVAAAGAEIADGGRVEDRVETADQTAGRVHR